MSQPPNLPAYNSTPISTTNLNTIAVIATNGLNADEPMRHTMIKNTYNKSSNRGSSHNNDRPTHSPTGISGFSINQTSQITKPSAMVDPMRNNYHFSTISHVGGQSDNK